MLDSKLHLGLHWITRVHSQVLSSERRREDRGSCMCRSVLLTDWCVYNVLKWEENGSWKKMCTKWRLTNLLINFHMRGDKSNTGQRWPVFSARLSDRCIHVIRRLQVLQSSRCPCIMLSELLALLETWFPGVFLDCRDFPGQVRNCERATRVIATWRSLVCFNGSVRPCVKTWTRRESKVITGINSSRMLLGREDGTTFLLYLSLGFGVFFPQPYSCQTGWAMTHQITQRAAICSTVHMQV